MRIDELRVMHMSCKDQFFLAMQPKGHNLINGQFALTAWRDGSDIHNLLFSILKHVLLHRTVHSRTECLE